MAAKKLVFLSDVPGLLVDGRLRASLTATVGRRVLDEGDASGGMRPKLEAALHALAAGVERVHLVDGRVPHALLLEIFTDHGVGTLVVPDREERTP
jgi:acetylglutamate kinase